MREFTKAMFSFSLAVSLFGLKQAQNLLTPQERDERRAPATKAFDSVTNATTDQFGETLNSLFRMLDNVQRGLVGLTFSFFQPFPSRDRRDDAPTVERLRAVQWESEPRRQDTAA